jgi:uncharacterized coiled-coil protein SlyX
MPARKPDAEAAPPEMGPDVGTIDPVELQNALVDTQQFVLEQQKAIEARDEQLKILMERLDKVENRTERIEDHSPPVPKPNKPQALPKGTKRYRATFTDASYFKEGGHRQIVDGIVTTTKPIVADFNGGVYTTSDPKMQEFLDTHPENGIGFFEDSTAQPNHGDVQVDSGPRQSEGTAKNPLEAVLP